VLTAHLHSGIQKMKSNKNEGDVYFFLLFSFIIIHSTLLIFTISSFYPFLFCITFLSPLCLPHSLFLFLSLSCVSLKTRQHYTHTLIWIIYSKSNIFWLNFILSISIIPRNLSLDFCSRISFQFKKKKYLLHHLLMLPSQLKLFYFYLTSYCFLNHYMYMHMYILSFTSKYM